MREEDKGRSFFSLNRTKYIRETTFFVVVASDLTPCPLLANIGFVSTCHTMRKGLRERKGRQPLF
jgi:hypothetical protein